MQVQSVFRKALSTLHKIGQSLHFQLSAEQELLAQQFKKIQAAQTYLEQLEQKLTQLFAAHPDALAAQAQTQLVHLIQAMAHEVHTLHLLAEELPSDPAGTVDCAKEVHAKIQEQLHRIKQLKRSGLIPQPNRRMIGTLDASFAQTNRRSFTEFVELKARELAVSTSSLAASTRGAF